jgi:hypothetical protein
MCVLWKPVIFIQGVSSFKTVIVIETGPKGCLICYTMWTLNKIRINEIHIYIGTGTT